MDQRDAMMDPQDPFGLGPAAPPAPRGGRKEAFIPLDPVRTLPFAQVLPDEPRYKRPHGAPLRVSRAERAERERQRFEAHRSTPFASFHHDQAFFWRLIAALALLSAIVWFAVYIATH